MPLRIRPDAWTPAGGIGLEPRVDLVVRSSANAVVIAGPGAGKTEPARSATCYLLQTGICPPPRRILAISFKRDAARNLGDRVARRCAPELARRFDSLTFDAFAKNLLDRFGRALPEQWRPSEDYAIDFEIKERKARELLDSDIYNSYRAECAAGIAAIQPESFYRDSFTAKLPEVPQAPSSTSERAAMILWRRFLHRRHPSTLNFEMINRLAELLLRANPKVLAALPLDVFIRLPGRVSGHHEHSVRSHQGGISRQSGHSDRRR